MNYYGILGIFIFEMNRGFRTFRQTILAPIVSTSLYFIIFGSAIGKSFTSINEIPYGSFMVPGLIMMTIISQSVSNTSFGIYYPSFSGTIYEILSAPISPLEITIGYIMGGTCKALIVGSIVLITSTFFTHITVSHPFWMIFFFIISCITFSIFGFMVGIWADSFEQLHLMPVLVIMPLSFLGGSFYSIDMLPPFWQKISLLNPIMYIISGFRWSFYDSGDVSLTTSIVIITFFLILSICAVMLIFKTGYRLKK